MPRNRHHSNCPRSIARSAPHSDGAVNSISGAGRDVVWRCVASATPLVESLASSGQDAIVACSALRDSYRRLLAAEMVDVRWVYLRASAGLLHARVTRRPGHFAGPAMLDDQLERLEEPADALCLDAGRPVPVLLRDICAALALDCRRGG